MKKKLFILFIVFILLFNVKSVVAEEEESEERKAGEYKFVIEKFAVRLYEIDLTNLDRFFESYAKYQRNEYVNEVIIPTSEVTMHPATFTKSKEDFRIQFLELNTNFTQDKIYSYIKDIVTDKKEYIGELVVYFHVTQVPTGYNKFYSMNAYKSYLWNVDQEEPEDNKFGFSNPTKEVALNESTNQVINVMTLLTPTKDSSSVFTYYSDIKDLNPEVLVNYFGVSKSEEEDEEEGEQETDMRKIFEANVDSPEISSALLFTNITDTDDLAKYILIGNKQDPIDPGDITNPGEIILNPNAIKIPNTAMDHSKIILIIGLIMITLGSVIVSKIIHNKD